MVFFPCVQEKKINGLKEFSLFFDGAVLELDEMTEQLEGSFKNLSSNIFLERVMWGGEAEIKVDFEAKEIDSLILGGCSFTEMDFNFNFEGFPVFIGENIEIVRKTTDSQGVSLDQKIFIFEFEKIKADRLELKLKPEGRLNKLWVGKSLKISNPTSVATPIIDYSERLKNDKNIAVGVKRHLQRLLNISWDSFDDFEKRAIERYFEAVGTIKPHYIRVFNDDWQIPPMFGVLNTNQINFSKKRTNHFWDGISLEFEEAR